MIISFRWYFLYVQIRYLSAYRLYKIIYIFLHVVNQMVCYIQIKLPIKWFELTVQVKVYLYSYVISIMKNKYAHPPRFLKQIEMRISSLNLYMPLALLYFLEVGRDLHNYMQQKLEIVSIKSHKKYTLSTFSSLIFNLSYCYCRNSNGKFNIKHLSFMNAYKLYVVKKIICPIKQLVYFVQYLK